MAVGSLYVSFPTDSWLTIQPVRESRFAVGWALLGEVFREIFFLAVFSVILDAFVYTCSSADPEGVKHPAQPSRDRDQK